MEPPKKIGKYEVLGVAGRGAMGTVYLAHDPFIDRKVAVKLCSIVDTDEAAAQIARRMFFNEAQAAGSLDNSNILRIYDAGDSDGQPYIVMEYVEGGATLQPHCGAEKLLPVERVLQIMRQCAEALDYAHRRGVTHRDIKPSNIMLTREGVPKIADFGIAHRVNADATQLVGSYGSPRYMSPEQAQEKALSQHTDLYSLGVTMYELLCGHPPHSAKSLPRLIYAITHEEAQPLREHRPELSQEIEAVVARAMAKDITQRYQSGAEMAAALAALLSEPEPPAELSEEQKFDVVRKLTFFNDFSDSELEEVLSVAAWTDFEANAEIINEGTSEQAFYVIVSGDVRVEVGEKQVAQLSKGECFGEIGYLSDSKRIASVAAVGAVAVLKIESILVEWASIPCQMRFNKVFQRTILERLRLTTLELAKYKA